MLNYYILALAGLAANVNSLPLNINLGAYSPALVVGDGEISFGGRQDVSQLMNALEGAAVNAATGATNGAAQAQPATAAAEVVTPAATTAAESPAVAAAAADPQLQEQAASIATLQGMGKEIAPREGETVEAPKAKRDLAGFDRALQYAENALTKGPKVELGTGAEGSGVGIIVDNRPATAAGAAGAAEGAVAARDESSAAATQPRRRTKVTTMYVKRGIPASLQSSENDVVARGVQPLPVVAAPSKVAKRDSATIDAVNLNVEGSQGITMTFVETADEDDE